MRPCPVKKRETSLPRSASRAIASADTVLAGLRVFFIQPDLLLRRLPKGDKVQDFSLFVFPDFENDRIKTVTHPTDGQELFWNIGPLIEPIRPGEQLLRLFEPDASARIRPEATALSRVEAKTHLI